MNEAVGFYRIIGLILLMRLFPPAAIRNHSRIHLPGFLITAPPAVETGEA